jgi:hypothetical protein
MQGQATGPGRRLPPGLVVGRRLDTARPRRLMLVVPLVLMSWILLPAVPATAFGTIAGGGQHREHERITRAALSCADSANSSGECFAARSMDQLAGHGKGFGGIGAPDSDEIAIPAAHCDDADFLPDGYPRTRAQATARLTACVEHLRTRFHEAVVSAGELLDDKGQVLQDEVILDSDCQFFDTDEGRAKCASIEGLGRALHGAQDFYAHSNWADEADSTRPVGPDNPPGLNRPGPSVLLDLRGDSAVSVPVELSTGCFVLKDRVPGVGECLDRVTHAALNKDNGLIDPLSGGATDPTTARGAVRQNFAKAVSAAINETRRQWQDFRAELSARYGDERAARMICAITRDDPIHECNGPIAVTGDSTDSRGAGLIAAVLIGVGVTLVAAVLIFGAGPRRRRGQTRRSG